MIPISSSLDACPYIEVGTSLVGRYSQPRSDDEASASALFLNGIYGELRQERLFQLFDDGWRPCLIAGPLKQVETPHGGRNYIQRVLNFYEGAIQTSDITKNAPVDAQAGLKIVIV
jgi:hypothetical protein